jgi:Rod binding domain-containing protein
MSIQGPTGTVGLPAVNQALEPGWVRRGSASTQKAYETALAFEQTLVEQLSQSLTASSGLEGESSDEGEAGSEAGGSSGGELSSMLPQALTGGVMHAGGLGLAAQLTSQLQQTEEAQSALAQAHATGGSAPAPSVGAATDTARGTTTAAPDHTATTSGGTAA